jgi:hypothetical protein
MEGWKMKTKKTRAFAGRVDLVHCGEAVKEVHRKNKETGKYNGSFFGCRNIACGYYVTGDLKRVGGE